MEKQDKQRLEQLVRQGIVPSSKLPILMLALSNLQMGKQLNPAERDILAKYMFNLTDIMLKDDSVFNRARLHTQKTKYQTEENTVELDESVRVIDGPEDEENQRKAAQMSAKRLGRQRGRDRFRLLSPALKKEKLKAGVAEEVVAQNEAYKEMFELALEQYGVSNLRDLPEDKKAEFFAVVDEATKPPFDPPYKTVKKGESYKDRYGNTVKPENIAKHLARKGLASVKKEEVELDVEEGYDRSGKWIGNDNDPVPRDRPGADDEPRNRKKVVPVPKMSVWKPPVDSVKKEEVELDVEQDVKKESFEDNEKRREKARADMAAGKYNKDGSVKVAKVKLKSFASVKKEETELDEATPSWEKEGSWSKQMKARQNAEIKRQAAAAKKKRDSGNLTKEETELTFEEMTPAQKAARLKLISQKADYIQSGAAAKKTKKIANSDMKAKGAQRGMAPTKKDEVDEEVELTFEEMTPAQKADRLKMIARGADRVHTGAAAKAVKKIAKYDMSKKGAQKGMAPTKKDEVEEQVKQLRQMIKENTNKAEAYKLLAKILNNTEKLGEE